MKTSTLFFTLLPLALAAPQDTNAIEPSDFIAEGFNTQAANYLASAFANPGVSSAFDVYDTAIASAVATQASEDVASVPTNSAGQLDPNAILSAFVPGYTVVPTADRNIISSVIVQALSLENGAAATATGAAAASGSASGSGSGAASVSGAASSLAHSASSVASSAGAAATSATPSKAAAAPKQTMAVGFMGAMLAGVAGLAAAL